MFLLVELVLRLVTYGISHETAGLKITTTYDVGVQNAVFELLGIHSSTSCSKVVISTLRICMCEAVSTSSRTNN